MNNRQINAIDRCMKQLTSAFLPNLLLTHLVLNELFSEAEKQSVQRGSDNDQMTLLTTFQLLKYKKGGWEILMDYLQKNNYGGQWVEDLKKWGSPDLNDNCNDERRMAVPPSETTSSSTAIVGSTKHLENSNGPNSSMPYCCNLETMRCSDNEVTVEAVQSANMPTPTATSQAVLVRRLTSRHIWIRRKIDKTDSPGHSEDSNDESQTDKQSAFDTSSPSVFEIKTSKKFFPEAEIKAAESELPDVINLMSSQMKNIQVQMSCLRLIEKYDPCVLILLGSTLRQRIVEVLLSGVKLHSHDSRVVDKFCTLLGDGKINVDRKEIGQNLWAIDCLQEIICDDINLTTTARKSAIEFLGHMAWSSDSNSKNLIGDKVLKSICQSIRLQIKFKSEYDEILEISWNCIRFICSESVTNKIRFVSAGGISLFQLCYKKFSDRVLFVCIMTRLMWRLSEEESIRPELIANDNLAILWDIWREPKDWQISSNCSQIFFNLIADSPANWPFGLGCPTLEEVKTKLSESIEIYSPLLDHLSLKSA